ncbi:MAG: sugar transferase [Isosphaera sp.]|nr:sugar transferase [Isosphaera sp.]
MAQRTSRLSGLLTPRPAVRPPVPSRPSPDPPPAAEPSDRVRAAADFAAAAALAVVALPVFFFCAVLVRITSRGPAVYTQARVGRGGRVFTLYKIRTMYRDSERHTGPRWCAPGDPRITPVGCVLRKLHLDELPQLWNVLKGDMSLIGPRPERPEIAARLRQSVQGYDRRHAVKPGITGFAQVHLPPDTCLRSVRNKLAYDLFYIRHRSARMTAYVLAATGLKLLGLKALYRRKPRVPTE